MRAGSARILNRLVTDASDNSLPGIPHSAPAPSDADKKLDGPKSISQGQLGLVDSLQSVNSSGQLDPEISDAFASWITSEGQSLSQLSQDYAGINTVGMMADTAPGLWLNVAEVAPDQPLQDAEAAVAEAAHDQAPQDAETVATEVAPDQAPQDAEAAAPRNSMSPRWKRLSVSECVKKITQ